MYAPSFLQLWLAECFLYLAIMFDHRLRGLSPFKKIHSPFFYIGKRKLIKSLSPEYCYTVFQPIVQTKSEQVIGYEALTRVPSDLGFKNIEELLLFAERRGVYSIVEKILTLVAISTFKRFPEHEEYRLFINTSPQSVISGLYTKDIQNGIFYNLKVAIEFVEKQAETLEAIKQIRESEEAKASLIVLDNFGSEYSNFFALIDMRPNIVKVSRDLVSGIDVNSEKQRIFEGLVQLAQILGIETLAEGVETREELTTVMNLGATYAQGFYIGKPDIELKDITIEARKDISGFNKFYSALKDYPGTRIL